MLDTHTHMYTHYTRAHTYTQTHTVTHNTYVGTQSRTMEFDLLNEDVCVSRTYRHLWDTVNLRTHYFYTIFHTHTHTHTRARAMVREMVGHASTYPKNREVFFFALSRGFGGKCKW